MSTPILEDDYYRYLCDGGVLANGFNPYRYSPRELIDDSAQNIPADLLQLVKDADPIPKRINYLWLRTIYPALSAGAFALAHRIGPWNPNAWRLVLLTTDLVVLYLIYSIHIIT